MMIDYFLSRRTLYTQKKGPYYRESNVFRPHRQVAAKPDLQADPYVQRTMAVVSRRYLTVIRRRILNFSNCFRKLLLLVRGSGRSALGAPNPIRGAASEYLYVSKVCHWWQP